MKHPNDAFARHLDDLKKYLERIFTMLKDTQSIYSFTLDELELAFTSIGIPKYRALQVFSWLYDKGVSSYDEMTNLPKSMREQLSSCFPIESISISKRLLSKDGSVKYLLELHDGCLVETVGIPSDSNRLTVCVSTQSGCAMGCIFCATGKCGLNRSLEPGEIVRQVIAVQNEFSSRVTNVVLMGQGEPFANYENVLTALRIINHPKLLGIGARHLTVSTCGLIDGINKFSHEREQFTLAVSLHSAIQSKRDVLIPAMKSQKLSVLRNTLIEYSGSTGRRYSFEYALMKDLNDSEEDLSNLIKYCSNLLCHVNLIPLNKVPGSEIHPVSNTVMQHWNSELLNTGIASSIRNSRGSDIAAACGQLALSSK